jgi:2-dehydropantoate 2-reductase
VNELVPTDNSQFEFAILGAGAIGSIIGGHLARAGHSVVMLVRERRAKQIEADGLRIAGLAEFSVSVPTLSDFSQLRRANVLIIAMKMPGTAEALAGLRHVETDTTLSIQNSPLKDELLAAAFGSQRVLGALADTSGEMRASGEVSFTRNSNIFIGELSGRAVSLIGELAGSSGSRANRIASAIDASGVRATGVANITSLEWAKFAAWVALMAVSVTSRAATWKYLTDPESALVVVRLIREMGAMVPLLGIELTDQSVLPVATICRDTEEGAVGSVIRIGRQYEQNAPQHRMSSLQDLEAGRPLEIHETLGYAVKKAAELRINLPLLEAFYRLVSAIDRINRKQCKIVKN